MPETDTSQQISVADFANKIRSKYPNSQLYKDTPDDKLVNAWIAKDPKRQVYTKQIKGLSSPGLTEKQLHKQKIAQWEMRHPAPPSAVSDYGLNALPGAMGTGFSMAAAGKTTPVGMGMAALGGGAGEALKQIGQHFLIPEQAPLDMKEATSRILKEAGTQGGFELGGRVLGSAAFKTLSKLPHAKLINGILIKASELPNASGITKFTEDLMANVWPSAKIYQRLTETQTKQITTAAEDIGKAISHFKGDNEAMGGLVKKAVGAAKDNYIKALSNIQDPIVYQSEVDKVEKLFKTGLLGEIAKTRRPEAIAGALTSRSFGNQEVRGLVDMLAEHKSRVLDYARTQVLTNIFDKSMHGAIEPTAKGAKEIASRLTGNGLKQELDKIGEDRLSAIFNPGELKSIEKLEKTIAGVGSKGQSWLGKLKNYTYLTYIAGGFVGGIKTPIVQAALLGTMSKIMTNPVGVEAYENVTKAIAAQTPRLTRELVDVYKKYAERAHIEYLHEREQAEQEFKRQHNK